MPGPKTYTSDTDLPRKTGGIDYPADASGGKEKNANPGAVRKYGVFHGSPFAGVKSVKEGGDPLSDDGKNLNSDQPEGVETFNTIP